MRLSQLFWGQGKCLFHVNGESKATFDGNRRTKIIMGNREHKITNFRRGGGAGEHAPLFQGNMGTFTSTTLGGPRECIVC